MRQAKLTVRAASEEDLGPINDIYNHHVLQAHCTFDIEQITIEARREWFAHYETAGRHRARAKVRPVLGRRVVREAAWPRDWLLKSAESNARG